MKTYRIHGFTIQCREKVLARILFIIRIILLNPFIFINIFWLFEETSLKVFENFFRIFSK